MKHSVNFEMLRNIPVSTSEISPNGTMQHMHQPSKCEKVRGQTYHVPPNLKEGPSPAPTPLQGYIHLHTL